MNTELGIQPDELDTCDQLRELLCPIEVIPPEIIGHIIECTAEPVHASVRQILRLSHVSARWRSITLSHSRLFIHADWTRWAPELIRLWCKRANYQSLSIGLDDKSINSLYGALRDWDGDELDESSSSDLPYMDQLLETLHQAIPHAESLVVVSDGLPSLAMPILERVFAEPRPKMQRLKLSLPEEGRGPGDNTITITCPNLRWLSVCGVYLRGGMPPVNLNTLELHDLYSTDPQVTLSTLYGEVFTFCTAAKELTIRMWGNLEIIGPNCTLPNVEKLSLFQGGNLYSLFPYKSIMGHLELHRLREVSLEIHKLLSLDEIPTMLAALPDSVSHLGVCSIAREEATAVPLKIVTAMLLKDSSSAQLLPRLTHLECSLVLLEDIISSGELAGLSKKAPQMELEEVLIKLVQRRKLARVQLPLVSRTCIEQAAEYGAKIESAIDI
ncbi:hypothetical protein DL93DRAFT_2170908 [Clavulina sp. PMI_390]|nr:hypothetical protein DL93DRAFT_2170908 [Clavulina sp. PMI_390]